MPATLLTRGCRPGFTLVELLVVIVIIGLIAVTALPTVLPAIQHRQVSEAGRVLHGALVGARDKAIHDGQPSGIRLLPDPLFLSRQPSTINGQPNPQAGWVDPTQPLAYNRVVPIEAAPEYSEGYSTISPAASYSNAIHDPTGQGRTITITLPNGTTQVVPIPTLIIEETAFAPGTSAPDPPTSWFWNVRVGDRIQIGGAGYWYTIVGPMVIGPAQGNPEMFVNVGPPGATSPLNPTNNQPVEYLLLVNGQDDNGNGWIDEGWDGVDNNGDGTPDDPYEWEFEAWHGAAANGGSQLAYTIQRRPVPSVNAREIALPTSMVIDATTFGGTMERSRLPINRVDGTADILVNPDGTAFASTPYGTTASQGMGYAFFHFWLAERQDVAVPLGTAAPYLPIARPAGVDSSYGGPVLKGNYSLLTLFTRTGQIAVNEAPPMDDPLGPANGSSYDPGMPFRQAQQGVRSAP